MKAVRWAEGVKPLLVPIDQVKQHPDNPNNGDDENLVESIQVNGFVTAITADAKTGYIIAGNTRYRALHALGATQIPVLWVDHWEGKDSTRYLIGDNASARRAVMDQSAELELLKTLMDTDIGLTGTSVDQTEYERMLMEGAMEPPPDAGGFGQGPALLGLHQIIIDFQDDPDARDEAFAELSQRYEKVRTASI